jgi:UDP-3-O-[3-hydroxymyristoyl] glucosamine N-acyltransferase
MTGNRFFSLDRVCTVRDIIALIGADPVFSRHQDRTIQSLKSIDQATTDCLVFADGKAYSDKLVRLPACTLICTEQLAEFAPPHVATLVVKRPQNAFARVGRVLFPEAVVPSSFCGTVGVSAQSAIHATALLEQDVTVEHGAVIGENVEIGTGTLIGANVVIGSGCKIGRNCIIGPNASILHAFIGNRVIVHGGARIGQDGFGYVPGENGLEKMPHLGRVIIQDDVEVGANTSIDRGALDDTVIGEGSKIDNLVQIAHNVRIGRHCVITGHCGLSGSVTLGNGVMLGGRTGIADHIKVGDGAQIAAASGVMNDIPAGERWGGVPAQPLKDLFREVAIIRNMVREKREKRT